MNVDKIVDAMMAEFKQKLTAFCKEVDDSALTPGLCEQFCSGLSASISSAGTVGLRTFLQEFESSSDVVSAHGETFRYKGVREKTFLTPFGEMALERRCYQNKSDTKSYVPLDAAWGMEGQSITPQVREALLYSSAHITAEETAQLLKKCALFTPHATTIKKEVTRSGNLIEAHRDALDRAIRAEESAPDGTQALVVSIDGATVLLSEQGDRFGRRAERPRGDKPQAPSTAYRVAMVGSVTNYGAANAPGDTPERLSSRYVAHMPEKGCPTFKSRLEAEVSDAQSKAPPGTPRIVLLDGAREMWNYIDKHPMFDDYHKCIDYWHVVEHLSRAAYALFSDNRRAAEKWYEKYKQVLLESDDGAARICRSIDYYEPKHKRNKTDAKHLAEERTYFSRNGERMGYATFRANGWPIGSGPIEAACKTLIKTRLCRSGMRWSRQGGQRILALRTYVKSNRWDNAWNQIKQLHYAA